MGQKKKKRGGGGKKAKGRFQLTDRSSQAGDDQDSLAEELTALKSIFQDDIEVVSDSSQTQCTIQLRPYTGLNDRDVSAVLFVRCLPGYPQKPPKLQILPDKGFSKEAADQLLSLLVEQANISAREGRVTIFNLVEAAQEFLSEIIPAEQSLEPVQSEKDAISEGTFVSCSVDLFSDLCDGDDGSWGSHGTDVVGTQLSKSYKRNDCFSGKAKHEDLHPQRQTLTPETVVGLDVVEEGDEHSSMRSSQDANNCLGSSLLQNDSNGTSHKDYRLDEGKGHVNGYDSEKGSSTASFASVADEDSQNIKRDLLMVHLLRLACSSHASLAQALPEISSELHTLGVLSEHALKLAAEPPLTFGKIFNDMVEENMSSSRISHFFDAATQYSNGSTFKNSRYWNDFEEVRSLGRGGFGHVVLCKNKLDGRLYAVKKIRLKDGNPHVNDKILREVATLSRLQHQHVVRYYQAWFETQYGNHFEEKALGSVNGENASYSCLAASSASSCEPFTRQESNYLYIQMEYCPRTLRREIELNTTLFNKEYAWNLFRQIVEGLAHIHGQGIIHRDLTPSNIFFDVRNDVKIGDFGLAKFLKLEQLEQDQYFPAETTGVSIEGTGQVGTYFYTAPEIEQKWPQINEKVDMYSLGVVFFELWHPFSTAMERHIVLSDLKQKGSLPPSWIAEFPEQATLLRSLMSASPSDRPSALQVLQNALPPRMEDEWLNDILRMMHTAEDTYVYDRVVSTIFDEGRLAMRARRQNVGNVKMTSEKSNYSKNLEFITECRDNIIEVARDVFKLHGAKRMELPLMQVFDGCHFDSYQAQCNRKSVKLLTRGGDVLEVSRDLRSPFVDWVVFNQKSSFKRYEISWVYRRAIGHSNPNQFLQGDFDILGGDSPLTEAEAMKVGVDVASRFYHATAIDIRLSHGLLLEAIWSWAGIEYELRQSVVELLSLVSSSCPQSTNRKTNWGFVRRQLLQDLRLSEAAVDKLQTADIRFCGPADQALARLRGALTPCKATRKALEDLSVLLSYLRVWRIEKHVSIDILMPPPESYYREIYFQLYVRENSLVTGSEPVLLAIGGRYDHLFCQKWNFKYKTSPPGAVGISIALEKILIHSSIDVRPSRNDPNMNVLVCARGGGGLLAERMELVEELWEANIKAEFVAVSDPSLTEQYEYASEHDIKWLIIITEAGLSQKDLVKVRHLELKKEKEVEREALVKFLMDAMSTQFRNFSIWS